MSLEGRDAAEVAAGIRAIRDGSKAHPPVTLDGVDPAALAAVLTAPAS
jgi:hypothetical protein